MHTVHEPWKSYHVENQDQEEEVGCQNSHFGHFRGNLDSLPRAKVHQDPSDDKESEQLVIDSSEDLSLPEGFVLLKDLCLEKVIGGLDDAFFGLPEKGEVGEKRVEDINQAVHQEDDIKAGDQRTGQEDKLHIAPKLPMH